jgi:hypothetical protein
MVRILPGLVFDNVGKNPFMLGVFLHFPGCPFAGVAFELVIPLAHCIPPPLDQKPGLSK